MASQTPDRGPLDTYPGEARQAPASGSGQLDYYQQSAGIDPAGVGNGSREQCNGLARSIAPRIAAGGHVVVVDQAAASQLSRSSVHPD